MKKDLKQLVHENRYGVLFIGLIALVSFASFAAHSRFEEEVFFSIFSLVIIASINAIYKRTIFVKWFTALGLTTFITNIAMYFMGSTKMELTALSLDLLFLLCAMGAMFRHIFTGRKVNVNILLGAASLYLLLGISFAYIYTILDFLVPNSFSGAGTLLDRSHGIRALFSQYIYYSFVTQATVGYGDIMPANQYARFLSIMQATISQLYMTILIARLVGMHLNESK